MNKSTYLSIVIFAICLALFGAQAEPPKTTAVDNNLLRGPSVPDKVMQTLINTDMGGRFIPIQGMPDEAALSLVLIDPEHRVAAREAAQARRIATGMLLVTNIDIVKAASDAIRAGKEKQAQPAYLELYKQFNPEHVRDPLLDVWKDILSEKEHKKIKQIVDEYWDSWINWEMRNAKNHSEEARKNTQQHLSFQLFKREISEAYDWSLKPTQQRLESIYQLTEPTEKQHAAIREIMIDYIRQGKLSPTAEQRQTTAKRIYELLSDEQRLKLFSQALWQF